MKLIKKAKKITIKFFLNQLVEAVTDEKGRPSYPLYIQVTYNRKNMQLRSKYAEYYRDLKEVKPGLMDFEERVLRKIVAYESSTAEEKKTEAYDLKGLKRKYEVYSLSIEEALEHYLKPKLRLAILKTNDDLTAVLNFDDVRATVDRLHRAAQMLFINFDPFLSGQLKEDLAAYAHYRALFKGPNLSFDFPTIIDWVDGSYKIELEKILNRKYRTKPGMVRRVLELVDYAIAAKLEKMDY
jgi:hypothetical protein